MKIITDSPESTIDAGRNFGKILKKGDFVAFSGDLGAGKTTFIRGIAEGLELGDVVSSPTFAIVNEYRGGKIPVFHFDMYRIIGEDALESTGFYDYPLEDSVFLVEWSENIKNEIPENAIFVDIKFIDENSREIDISGNDSKSLQKLEDNLKKSRS